MCGLLGAYFFDRQAMGVNLKPFLTSLRHRGPDSQGEFRKDQCWLGHTRLSIVALNRDGFQPMTCLSRDERKFTASFNGEIYNYIEIREELRTLGHSFEGNLIPKLL